ncbi:MAG: ribonuclease HI, partial [Cyanobacteria bacterium J06649_4]
MPTVTDIYTDGACSGNPGPGGWGTRIEFADGQIHELGGRDTATTNNRMEMQAAIAALEFLQEADIAQTADGPVTLHTDSEYLKNGITKWIKGWKKKGWKTSSGKPVLNKDLWQQLDQISQTLSSDNLAIDWRYVRGHAGNPGNERCDEIARAYSHAQPINLKQHSPKTTNSPKTTKTKEVKTHTESQPLPVSQSKANAITNDHRESSLGTPEIYTGTIEESSGSAALRFYENTPKEESQAMTATASS